MTRRRLCTVAILTLLGVPAAAQGLARPGSGQDGLTGTWKGTNDQPKFGPITTVFEFRVDGNKLSGTFSNNLIPTTPIHDGIVKGTDVSFKVKLQLRVFGYAGRFKGNVLTLTSRVVQGPPLEGAPSEMKITVKREK